MTTTRSGDMSQSPTIRDTFAAAALAGMLPVRGGAEEMHETCSAAWGWADAMLRERATTNHDAAPAAKARTDADTARTDNAAPRPGDGTGIAPAIDRLREWERHGSGRWGLGAAGDVTMLERRLAIVEAIVRDAAPAARAAVAPCTGHTQSDTTWEPLCWCCSGPGIQSFHESKADAEEYREHSGIADEVEVFQVGRAFALTGAEREALEEGIRSVEYLAARGFGARAKLVATATKLWNLLARLGGER